MPNERLPNPQSAPLEKNDSALKTAINELLNYLNGIVNNTETAEATEKQIDSALKGREDVSNKYLSTKEEAKLRKITDPIKRIEKLISLSAKRKGLRLIDTLYGDFEDNGNNLIKTLGEAFKKYEVGNLEIQMKFTQAVMQELVDEAKKEKVDFGPNLKKIIANLGPQF